MENNSIVNEISSMSANSSLDRRNVMKHFQTLIDVSQEKQEREANQFIEELWLAKPLTR